MAEDQPVPDGFDLPARNPWQPGPGICRRCLRPMDDHIWSETQGSYEHACVVGETKSRPAS